MKGFVTGIPGNQGKGADCMRCSVIRQGAPGQGNFPDIHLQDESECSQWSAAIDLKILRIYRKAKACGLLVRGLDCSPYQGKFRG